MENINIYEEWEKLCQENREIFNEYMSLSQSFNKVFSETNSEPINSLQSSDKFEAFELSAKSLEESTIRMNEFVQKYAR